MSIRIVAVIGIALLIIVLACSGEKGIGPVTPEEPTAHEPWSDEEAENLAWLISGYTWAPRDLYERISADLDTIRERWGDSVVFTYPGGYTVNILMRCRHHSNWDPGDVWFEVEESTFDKIKNGEYDAWDSLNQIFGATGAISYLYAHVHSDDRVNPLRMIEAYERLPGIRHGWSPGGWAGDPPKVHAMQFNWGIGYLFEYGFGDCPAGCLSHAYYFFRSYENRIDYAGWYGEYSDSLEPGWWDEAVQCLELAWLGDGRFRHRDSVPPAAITDLTLVGDHVSTSATISFTSPGDDGFSGQAATYEVWWRYEPIHEDNWDVTPYHPEIGGTMSFPAQPPRTRVSLTLTSLGGDTTNYIIVRAVDGRGNMAPLSEVLTSHNILLNGWTCHNTGNSNLPSDQITEVYVDRNGITWVGTRNGVALLDNGNWQTFTTSDGLPSNIVTAFGEDGFGQLWVGTLEGLARYDGGHWTSFVPDGLTGNLAEIRCITGADDGSLWCGVGFSGAARFDGAHWTWFDSTNSGLRGSVVRDILVASNHDVWFATNQGVMQIDASDWVFHDPVYSTGTDHAMTLFESPLGTIVVGTDNGYISRFNGESWSPTQLKSTNPYGHGSRVVDDVVETTGGDLWLKVYESLRWYVDGDLDSLIVLTDANCGLPERDITHLAAGPDNSLWVGTHSSGVCRWELSEAGVGISNVP